MNFLTTLATTLLVVVQSIGDVKQHFPQPPDSEGQLEQSGSYTLAVEKSGKFLRQENPNVDQQSSDSSLREAPKMATKKFKPLKQLKHLRRHIREKTVAMKKKAQLVHRMILHGQKGLLPVGRGIDETPFKCKEEDTQEVYQEQERKFDILKELYLQPNRGCLKTKGTFRVSGSPSRTINLVNIVNNGTTSQDIQINCHDITSAMKKMVGAFLPLWSDNCWKIIKKESIGAAEIETWLNSRPWFNLFKKWVALLEDVKNNQEENKMPCYNLAVTPGGKLFKEKNAQGGEVAQDEVASGQKEIIQKLFVVQKLCSSDDFSK
eukprot:GEMP01015957.1.p1 GENE.GEMP01015957.1~~GEMP01015957.1.p1  ORF type:complete len:368 (+),score=39.49 GEMP01015957.1:146-1105(+)